MAGKERSNGYYAGDEELLLGSIIRDITDPAASVVWKVCDETSPTIASRHVSVQNQPPGATSKEVQIEKIVWCKNLLRKAAMAEDRERQRAEERKRQLYTDLNYMERKRSTLYGQFHFSIHELLEELVNVPFYVPIAAFFTSILIVCLIIDPLMLNN